MDDHVELITDGACLGNPGPGGWGAVLRCKGVEKRLSGAEAHSTNNRMELTAAIRGLDSLKKPCRVLLTTDSRYVMQGITEWLPRWRRRGWKTAAGKPVLNQDLWEQLDAAVARHEVEWRWVRGHTGHADNEAADQLARAAAEGVAGARA